MKLKKYTAFMVCFLLLINLLTLPSFKVKADGTSRIFYTTDSNITVGQDFNIYVNAENITDLYGASIDFKYDTNLMTVKSIQVGDAYAGLVSGSTSSSTGADYFVVDTSDLANGTGNFGVTLLGNTHATGLAITTAKKLFVITATAKAAGAVNLNFVSGEPTSATGAVNTLVKLSDSTSQPIAVYASPNSNITIPSIQTLVAGKYEENNANIQYVGTWAKEANVGYNSGAAMISNTNGSYATFKFNGTGFRWTGLKGVGIGIAKITIDGTSTFTTDNYSSSTIFKNIVFEKTGLTAGEHTVKIEITNTKNTAASNYYQAIDTIEILNTVLTAGNYEENYPYIQYVGTWAKEANVGYNSGAAMISNTNGSYATFKFNGTGFRWTGLKGVGIGIAKITIDGTSTFTTDNYSSSTIFKNVVFEKTGLTAGEHTIKIEITNTKNTAASNYYQAIDTITILNN
jgi:hypothetical protein